MADTGVRSTARGPRGEYAKSSAKRAAILESALEVFAGSGYRAGSLREIAQRVGMSEAGLLHHFRTKSALLMAVLDRRDEHAFEVTDFDSLAGVDRLRGLERLAVYNASEPGVVELYCTLSAEATAPDHPAHDYFVNRYEWTRTEITRAFADIQAEGRLLPGIEPAQAAISTIALMDGLQVQWLLNRDSVDMAAELSDFFRRIVAGYDITALDRILDLRAAQNES